VALVLHPGAIGFSGWDATDIQIEPVIVTIGSEISAVEILHVKAWQQHKAPS